MATALIVEDEPDAAEAFAIVMRSAGLEPEVAENGSLALRWLEENVPSLVVLDLRLPVVSGAVVLKHIREDPRLRNVAVVVATAYRGLLVRGAEDGLVAILDKPVNLRRLEELARDACRESPGAS